MSDAKLETVEDYRKLLLQFIGSLTVCEHMGDVSNDVDTVLRRLGVTGEWDDWPELADHLHSMGVTTLFGTSLARDSE